MNFKGGDFDSLRSGKVLEEEIISKKSWGKKQAERSIQMHFSYPGIVCGGRCGRNKQYLWTSPEGVHTWGQGEQAAGIAGGQPKRASTSMKTFEIDLQASCELTLYSIIVPC